MVPTGEVFASDTSHELDIIRQHVFSLLNLTYGQAAEVKTESHVRFCLLAFSGIELTEKLESLHSIQPWVMYWCLNSLAVLRSLNRVDTSTRAQLCGWLARCEDQVGGGYGGSWGMAGNLGTTYAGLLAGKYLRVELSQEFVDRFRSFVRRMEVGDDGFAMHDMGEVDSRSAYCALASCHILGLTDTSARDRAVRWAVSCQNLDGGFGSEPGRESHSGYTWCCLAALGLASRLDLVDQAQALEWCLHRQQGLEGGCNGRPDKAVDSCYSFYLAASVRILGSNLDSASLEQYILRCCQPCFQAIDENGDAIKSNKGGFCNKPAKSPDWYHTCYSLSGLALVNPALGLGRVNPLLNAAEVTDSGTRI